MTVPPAAYIPDAPILPREGWTATASQQSTSHPAEAALDSNAFSYWEGQTGSATPASITIDMRAPQVVSGLIYEPPQTPSPVGVIGQYEVSVSSDDVNFTTVATGTWANTTATKKIGIDAVDTRFVRLTAVSTAAGSGSEVAAAELYLQGTPNVAAALPASKAAVSTAQVSTNPAVVGEWGPTIGFPLVPVAAALLPNNEMLVWSADQALAYGASNPDDWTQTAILNLTTGAVSEDTVTNTDHNMFCPGIAILPNGDIMVTGGLGDQQTSIYDPKTNLWSAGPQMNIGRGYQGMTLLSNGQAFTLGGSWSGGLGTPPDGKLAEEWSPTGSWRELTNVPATPMYTADAQGVYRADNEGWFIATSGGKVLQAGPSKQMNWITYDRSGIDHPGRYPGHQRGRHERQRRLLRHQQGDHHGRLAQLPELQRHQPGIPDPDQPANQTPHGHPGGLDELRPRLCQQRGAAQRPGRDHGRADLCGAVQRRDLDSERGTVGSEHRHLHRHGPPGRAPQLSLRGASAARWPSVLRGGWPLRHLLDQPSGWADLHSAVPVQRQRYPSHPTDHHLRSDICGYRPDHHGHHRWTGVTVLHGSLWGGRPTRWTMTSGGCRCRSCPRAAIPTSWPSLPTPASPYPVPTCCLLWTPAEPRASPPPSPSPPFATQPPADSYGQAVFGDGPAAYWPLNEAGGATAADLSGNGDTANYLGGGFTYGVPSPVEGTGGRGVTLNGSTSQIVASQPITNPTAYSEEMWFKTTTTTGGPSWDLGARPAARRRPAETDWCTWRTMASSTSPSTPATYHDHPFSSVIQRR